MAVFAIIAGPFAFEAVAYYGRMQRRRVVVVPGVERRAMRSVTRKTSGFSDKTVYATESIRFTSKTVYTKKRLPTASRYLFAHGF